MQNADADPSSILADRCNTWQCLQAVVYPPWHWCCHLDLWAFLQIKVTPARSVLFTKVLQSENGVLQSLIGMDPITVPLNSTQTSGHPLIHDACFSAQGSSSSVQMPVQCPWAASFEHLGFAQADAAGPGLHQAKLSTIPASKLRSLLRTHWADRLGVIYSRSAAQHP